MIWLIGLITNNCIFLYVAMLSTHGPKPRTSGERIWLSYNCVTDAHA